MKLITSPDAAVTLAEAKAHLRVAHDSDDDLIAAYILSATQHFDGPDGRLRKAIMPQTWETAYDEFPEKEIALPLGPVLSVTSVVYTDPDGVEQTVDSADYEVDTYSTNGWVVPSADWPATMDTINAVRVQWVAGMSADSPAVCPDDIKAAILLKLNELYDGTDTKAAIDSMIHIRKRIVLA